VPTYIIERAHAERMQLQELGLTSATSAASDENIRWLFSFLSADRHKTYCLFEAPSPEALLAAAASADLPASAIIEVDRVDPANLGGAGVS
jgi:hypothetical protein